MLKTLHVTSARNWRGGEQQLSYIIEALNTLKIEQFVLCVKNTEVEKHFIDNGVNHISLKKSSGLSLTWAKEIKKICETNNITTIHCHDSKAHSYSIISADILKNKADIIVHRKVVFKLKTSIFTKYKYNHRLVKNIICISHAVETEIKKIVKKETTTVIYDAVKQPGLNNLDIREKYKISKENTLIVYLAALTQEKDHITFINTAKLLLDKNKNLAFLIIGSGKLEVDIKEYIQQLNLEKHIVLTGFIENAKTFIHQFDILLFTSKFEGLGTTILDFFISKKPVVCTKSGGAEEIINNNVTGLICEKEDADCLAEQVQKIITKDSFKNALVNNAYDYVIKNHNILDMGKQILNVYKL